MKKIIALIFIAFLNVNTFATHFVGGSITWECNDDPTSVDFGKFTFILKFYRDCQGMNPASNGPGGIETLTVHGHPTITNIDVLWDNTLDISPVLGGLPNCYDCNTMPAGFSQKGVLIHEITYKSVPINLGNGNIPDPTGAVWNPITNEYDVLPRGWHFTWGGGARNNCDNTTQCGNWLLRAIMYPYTKNTSILPFIYEDAYPCYDASPEFKEKAKTLICNNIPFSYSHLAFDPNFDSLSYSWANPLQGSAFNYDPAFPLADSMTFSNLANGGVYNFSLNQQIPTNPANPLTLNPGTGEISFLNDQLQGNFITCVRVRSVKCFQPIADVFREVQMVTTATGCNLPAGGTNTPPDISAPIGTHVWDQYINSAGMPSYETWVKAGELVEFTIDANDIDMQNIDVSIEGSQLSTSTLPNGMPSALATPADWSILSSSPGNTQGKFSWDSSCEHLQKDSCAGQLGLDFSFNIKAVDHMCPANGTTIANLTIHVIPPTPDLRCVAVDDQGDVELSWYYPSSVIDFNYDIYFSKNPNLGFSKIASVSHPDSTYLHSGSEADISSSYYYLISVGACQNSAPNIALQVDSISDTLKTMYLNATEINSVPIVANLLWNPMCKNWTVTAQQPHLFNLATTEKNYSLYYEKDPITGFNMFMQHPDTFMQKQSDSCYYTPRFYIEIGDESGCSSRSSLASVLLADDQDPDMPVIKDVSVNSTGQSVITWEPSFGAEFYAVYLFSSDGWIPIDTVYNSTTFTYNNSSASQESEIFSIRALDSCYNGSLASYDQNMQHNSIYLQEKINACDHTVDFSWNEYINWENGLSYYKIFVEEIDTLGNIINKEFKEFDEDFLLNVNDGFNYIVNVNAYNYDSSYSAQSNTLTFVPDLPATPDYLYIDYASVNHENDAVEINCLTDDQAVLNHYDVLRSEDSSLVKIGQINTVNSSIIHYTDETANVYEKSYKYYVMPVDTCGQRLFTPPVLWNQYINDTSHAKTILLETMINLDYKGGLPIDIPYNDNLSDWGEGDITKQYTNTLSFNEYEKWLGNVEKYDLYRSVNGGLTYNTIPLYSWNRISDPTQPLEYIDIVTAYGKDDGRICYYIHAIERDTLPYGAVPEGSYSNISCVSQTPILYVPSVFTPNGDDHNEIFFPVSFFVDEKGYSFSVYNRNGTQLFTTNDPQKGWDGTFLGNVVQNGDYIYHIQYINGVGELIDKKDVITLVR